MLLDKLKVPRRTDSDHIEGGEFGQLDRKETDARATAVYEDPLGLGGCAQGLSGRLNGIRQVEDVEETLRSRRQRGGDTCGLARADRSGHSPDEIGVGSSVLYVRKQADQYVGNPKYTKAYPQRLLCLL